MNFDSAIMPFEALFVSEMDACPHGLKINYMQSCGGCIFKQVQCMCSYQAKILVVLATL